MQITKVTAVTPKPNYVLALEFDNGASGDVCVEDMLFGPIFLPLRNVENFAKVTVDKYGAVYWPLKPQQPQEQPDIAPDALYQRLLASTAASN